MLTIGAPVVAEDDAASLGEMGVAAIFLGGKEGKLEGELVVKDRFFVMDHTLESNIVVPLVKKVSGDRERDLVRADGDKAAHCSGVVSGVSSGDRLVALIEDRETKE